MSVVAFAPASTANVSVGFDVLGAAMAPVDGSLLGDRVWVGETDGEFNLTIVGAYAHKLPDDFTQNIVYDCYLAFEKAIFEKGVTSKNLVMTLEKSMPVGSGLGSSATSIVAAFVALNAFYDTRPGFFSSIVTFTLSIDLLKSSSSNITFPFLV